MRNSKPFLLIITLAALMLFGSFTGDSGRHIMWGSDGHLDWVVYENRQFYKLDTYGSMIYETGYQLDKKTIRDIFDHFDAIKFKKIQLVHNCNFNIIKYVSTGHTHKVCWQEPSHLGKYEGRIIEFYSHLNELTKRD